MKCLGIQYFIHFDSGADMHSGHYTCVARREVQTGSLGKGKAKPGSPSDGTHTLVKEQWREFDDEESLSVDEKRLRLVAFKLAYCFSEHSDALVQVARARC